MSETKKAAAMAAFVSIAVGLFFLAAACLRESRAEALAAEAREIALDAKDEARASKWAAFVANAGPHVGMPITYRGTKDASDERPGILVSKVGDGWMIALFDSARAEWAVIGPVVEGTRDELDTWTPAICAGMRPGFTGVGHEHGWHAGHAGHAGATGVAPGIPTDIDTEH